MIMGNDQADCSSLREDTSWCPLSLLERPRRTYNTAIVVADVRNGDLLDTSSISYRNSSLLGEITENNVSSFLSEE
jgi:hypothetical protein